MGARARPWERTGAIDVELLAQWAYGVQMVDRFEAAGLHRVEAMAAGLEPSSLSADGVGQLMQIEHLGCRIDRGGVQITDNVHPAAYAVAGALREIANGDRVRFHALAGTRPAQWQPPERKVRAAIWIKEGTEAMVEYEGPGRKGGYCQVIYTWDARREAWGREQYTVWWEALGQLAYRLSTYAFGFIVTGPAAPASPWHPKSEAGRPISLDESVEAGGPPNGSSQSPRR
ncbi:hypothetical protein [Novosphingobium mangrovi (ex Huang et al. 2023)]|uniref:Uncharacterized protein n=1 Tax=Novosphingobium mangrovi (ex Huang et al. 2023) TaxID=2976432 RepID=A0ABT2I139_9SPHN|nr:hypothetical protein [Novosphingobium mangrovi (ex Huang et al. 2023)]MCT2398515.1 hypothetical protein [Novosphingobium mangrovi (ex Huang et al. 2023)]